MFQVTVSAGGMGPFHGFTGQDRLLLQHGLSMGSQPLAPQAIPAWDPPWAVVWISPCLWPSMSCRGRVCFTKPHRVEQYTKGTE